MKDLEKAYQLLENAADLLAQQNSVELAWIIRGIVDVSQNKSDVDPAEIHPYYHYYRKGTDVCCY